MPSLKDLKNRIGSVKNTRKITKAMQMVAAAKLRRAQDAAEAARPYAERMNAVIAGLASSVAGSSTAPRLLAGTGKDQVHLLVVMTAERGLCGGFNSTIARLARARANELLAAGKTVKILTVGKKGREALKRDLADKFVGHVDLSEVRKIGYDNAQAIARDVLARFDAGEFDVATLFFNRFQSVISQIPTALQVIPAKVEVAAAPALYDYEPRTREVMEAWFEAKEKARLPVIGVLDVDGTLMGFGSYGPFRPHAAYHYSVEHSVYVDARFRGRGLGRLILERLIDRARAQEYHMMIGVIDAENATSIALHEKLGFQNCGLIRQAGYKFGRWLDLALYQYTLQTPHVPVDG